MNQTILVFGYPDTVVKEFNHWVIMVRPHQVTLGTLVLASKSDVARLGDLSTEEWAEFSEVTKYAETLLASTFGAERFNYLALMMKDPNPHFHMVPRYSQPVSFNHREWTDEKWPGPTNLQRVEVTDDEVKAIVTALRA